MFRRSASSEPTNRCVAIGGDRVAHTPHPWLAARSSGLGRVSRPLQARAKRNAIVHAATSAPRSFVVHRSFRRPPLSPARSSPVVRPNTRLRRTRLRAPPKRVLGRRRFVAAAHLPPSRLRAAAGRCTVRRHHRSPRNERHTSTTRRSGTSPRTASPLPPHVTASSFVFIEACCSRRSAAHQRRASDAASSALRS